MPNVYGPEDLTKQSRKTILVVEDDIHVGYFLAQALKEEVSYKVIFATDGLQALRMIRTVLPDLILLDYHLPHMDGFELIDHLRASTESEHIPVILISGNLPERLPKRKNVMYLKKPFELDALLQHVTDLLERSTPA
ncbi:response regulator [Ktedonobacter racemifer]|uniref:Response regulator receiver protein n=1 Tax=Ktedonobacter racemifer DSM 44963 TaxID=485913 RepID=D6U4B8_KTERA|nr:response regulator [Ktedonobacter racemifer]EFH81348.1 response regulator receiver protein [Ktedonobacter racemifer DSM 44963]